MTISRRHFLQSTGVAASTLAMSEAAAQNLPNQSRPTIAFRLAASDSASWARVT